MIRKSSYSKLSQYISKEYVFSFIIAFIFFFFVFFVNQILVIAQKIVIKNIEFSMVLKLVVYSIPQFLMYTMPFSSLASASMVIGNLSSQNEILAMRSSGINLKRLFAPIVFISLILSVCTFFISDLLIPNSADKYRTLYSEVIQSLPTIELEDYSSSKFGNIVLSNGIVEGNVVYDLKIYDNSDVKESRIINSEKAILTLLDIDTLMYKVDLYNAQILMQNKNTGDTYKYSSAEQMQLYVTLNEHGMISETSINPSQMSVKQLLAQIEEKKNDQMIIDQDKEGLVQDYSENLGNHLKDIDLNSVNLSYLMSSVSLAEDLNDQLKQKDFSFYYQYYRSELYKKFALSLACTFLIFIAFPISFFRVRYGKLVGFGLSMIIACLYWFFLYFMQTRTILTYVNPLYYMLLPDFTVFVIGIVLLLRLRKN